MIDASSFASHHNAFWSEHTPTSEHFVRRLNLEWSERWCPPMPKPKDEIRPALVAEFAFSKFCQFVSGARDVGEKEALEEAISRLRPLVDDPSSLASPVTVTEGKEVAKILDCLRGYFGSRREKMLLRPVFYGCGYVDSSEGDIITGQSLFEVKTVDRPFRSIDIRQLVTYVSLNHLSRQFSVEKLGIFNPRRGVYFEMPVDTICYEISGQSSQELFDAIIHAISSGDISR